MLLLGMNDNEMGEHMTGSDVPVIENVAKAVVVALGKMRDRRALITEVSGGEKNVRRERSVLGG
jgi:hypothetical protein